MIEILPGINDQSFDEARKKIEQVRDLVPWIHLDVADNTMTKTVTTREWEAFKVYNGDCKFEVHLMVDHPEKYVEPLVQNGFDRLIAHVETDTVREFITRAREHHVEVGVAIDAPTDLEVVEPFLHEVDTVLVMMYAAGPSGQTFQHEQLTKIRKIHEEFKALPIEVDGGIDKATAPLVITAGATRLVSTSYLFWKNKDRIAEAIEELKGSV